MPSVIDSLVVALSLDSADFKTRMVDIDQMIAKFSAATTDKMKEVERSGISVANAILQIRNEFIALFAVFTGGYGLTEFIAHTVTMNANLGRMAANAGIATRDLYAWGEAARQVGGDADTTRQTIFGMQQDFERFSITGQSQLVPLLRAIGVNIADVNTGKMRDMSDILMDLARWAQTVPRTQANAVLTMLGLDQGTVNLLLQGEPAVKQWVEHFKQMAPSAEDVRRAQEFQGAWAQFRSDLDALARDTFLETFGTDLDEITKKTHAWMLENGPWLRGELHTRLTEFNDDLHAIITSLGGVENATNLVLDIWLGNKLLRALTRWGLISASFRGILSVMTALLALKGDTPDAPGDQHLSTTQEEAQARQLGGETFGMWWRRTMPSWLGGTPGGLASPLAWQNISPEARAFLDNIAGHESGGRYDVLNGGEQFDPATGHPHRIGAGGTSTAAGRYQITGPTYDDFAPRYGISGFGPEAQDRLAWAIANETYMRQTGRDLASDLASGGHQGDIARALQGRWPWMTPQNAAPAPPAVAPVPPSPHANPLYRPSSYNNSMSIGSVQVYTQATDATGIAKDLRQTLMRYAFVAHTNSGLA